jgi:hypothetical protein
MVTQFHIDESYSRKLDNMVSIQEPPYGYDIGPNMTADEMEEAREAHSHRSRK